MQSTSFIILAGRHANIYRIVRAFDRGCSDESIFLAVVSTLFADCIHHESMLSKTTIQQYELDSHSRSCSRMTGESNQAIPKQLEKLIPPHTQPSSYFILVLPLLQKLITRSSCPAMQTAQSSSCNRQHMPYCPSHMLRQLSSPSRFSSHPRSQHPQTPSPFVLVQ